MRIPTIDDIKGLFAAAAACVVGGAAALSPLSASPAAAQQAVILSEDFAGPSSKWLTYSGQDGVSQIVGGVMNIRANNSGYAVPAVLSQTFTDVVIEVDTRMVGGDDDNWHLIECRRTGPDSFASFGVSADGYFEIVFYANGALVDRVGPTRSSHIRLGVGPVNRIRAECVGDRYRLWINGALVQEAVNTRFTAGEIALGGNALGGQYTEIEFDNLVISRP